MQYSALHCHSHFSLMDGVATPAEYAQRASDIGMTSLALTDHGTLSGHREWVREMRAVGVKPILGVEAYFTADRFDQRDKSERNEPLDLIYNHLTVLAKNNEGLQNLGKLNEIAWNEGFYKKPRIDYEVLDKYGNGLIISSACMSGLLNKAIEIDDYAAAKRNIMWFKERFGEDFYVEVMPHNTEGMNIKLLELADSMGIQSIVTPDCHHSHSDQKVIQELMLILNTHSKLEKGATYSAAAQIADPMERLDFLYGADRRMTFRHFDIHLLSGQEMWDAMAKDGVERADIFENTLKIADSVDDYDIQENMDLLPVEYRDPDIQLLKLASTGLTKRGITDPKYLQRLNSELQIISDKHFAPYFIVVRNMIAWAKRQGILVGPGRGSAVGSLVCYALGITEVDPIEHNLLFSRFVDPSRDDWPDIDTDIEDARREEVKDYLVRQYRHVASIATLLTFKDKGIVRDVSRVFHVPLTDVNSVLKTLDTWEEFAYGSTAQWFREKYPEVAIYGEQLRGRIRGTGIHPAGIVTSKEPISKIAPMETRSVPKASGRMPVVALDMDEAARVGLIKIDALGLSKLSVISDTLATIAKRHKEIKLEDIPLDDSKIYQMLSNGYTQGVFQCEATPYTNLLVKMGVKNLDELSASNALVRPGAMNTIGKEYIARKHGRKPVTYIHQSLKDITSETYGEIVYQEQVMQACTILGGMTDAEANKVRKIIGKKKDAKEFDAYRDKFVAGAAPKVGTEAAEDLWKSFEAHAGYSFNKCASGKTLVRRASSGRYTKDPNISLSDLYDAWHSKTAVGKKYRSRGVKIMALDADGRVRPRKIVGIHQNGIRKTFRVTLSNGVYIDATANHKHLTNSGYRRVDELTVGDTMFYSSLEYEPTVYVKTLGSGWGKATQLRMRAADGRMRPSLGGYHSQYAVNVALLTDDCANCGSNIGRLEVAHLNSDNKDNRYENLARLCNSCHKKLDYEFGSRKPRHSKGYSVHPVEVVSVESNGFEMTYDVEMDSVEHNWLGNGIVTHNSHAVAYSTISYWTAWFKYYYPLEFIYCLLKNEADKDKRTEYLIEAKRLNIPIKLPHINESDTDFKIEGDSIRFGLSSIKYISDTIAQRYIAKRPFHSKAEVEEFTFTKGAGVNSRAMESMDRVGALAFPDNPVNHDKVRQSLYEYLNLPEFTHDIPAWYNAFLTQAEDYEEKGAFLMLGMVRNIKRGKGWSRVELLDKTGTVGIFDNEHTLIETGKTYLLLVGDNRIVKAIPGDEIRGSEEAIVKFLNYKILPYGQGEYFVLAFKGRTTKAGKKMATVMLANHDRELASVVVFPSMYGDAFIHLNEGQAHKINLGATRDGGIVYNGVVKG